MNDIAEIKTEALFTKFGIADMLELNVDAKNAAGSNGLLAQETREGRL